MSWAKAMRMTVAFAMAACLAMPPSALATETNGEQGDLAAGNPIEASVDAPAATSETPEALADEEVKVRGTFFIGMAGHPKKVVGLRDESRKEGASVQLRAKRGTNLQRFAIKKAGKGLVYLQNVGTGRVAGLKKKSKASGTDVVMRDKKGKAMQKWRVVRNGSAVSFVNAYSGLRLNIEGGKAKKGANINVRAANDSAGQRFSLKATKKKAEEVTIDVPCYLQNPELPTGCESVALTNALRYWGFRLGKGTIARNWMPYGADGVYDFIGSPYNDSGWIICAPGIKNTANAYLKARKSKVKAKVVHGASLKSLRKHLAAGRPVVVWTTIGMGEPGAATWKHGYPLRSNNHAVVLSGYNPKNGNYRVSDSLAGTVWRDGARFTRLYNLMGRQAVVLMR